VIYITKFSTCLSFNYIHIHRFTMWFPHVTQQIVVGIGHGGMIAWLPWIPGLTPLEFCVWRYVKDEVFVLPLPASLEELQAQMTEVVAAIDADMIHRIWDKITYRWDICCVTWGNQTEHLWISVDKTWTYTAFCDIS